MAAHLTKQIPAAPVVKASAALYWLPAFFLHLMVKANSLDEVSAFLAVLQTDEFKVMQNRLLAQMQGFD